MSRGGTVWYCAVRYRRFLSGRHLLGGHVPTPPFGGIVFVFGSVGKDPPRNHPQNPWTIRVGLVLLYFKWPVCRGLFAARILRTVRGRRRRNQCEKKAGVIDPRHLSSNGKSASRTTTSAFGPWKMANATLMSGPCADGLLEQQEPNRKCCQGNGMEWNRLGL
jgi:hypothetical protein